MFSVRWLICLVNLSPLSVLTNCVCSLNVASLEMDPRSIRKRHHSCHSKLHYVSQNPTHTVTELEFCSVC